MEEQSPPASPGVSPVHISDAIYDLLRFTLSSSDSASDLALSRDFCSRLLLDDSVHLLDDHRSGNGVLKYPLYKHLARELGKCLESGVFVRREGFGIGIPGEDECLRIKENDWDVLMSQNGSKLNNIYESVNFELHVQEPYFSHLKDGTKKVEGRLATGNYNKVTEGSLLLFNKCLLLRVERITKYSSLHEMLQVEKLENVLPGVSTIQEGVAVYRKFYTEEREKANGVFAISVSKPGFNQPYVILKEILNGLSYEGIGRLLGVAHTSGTVSDALPPSKSVLLSAATKTYQPDIKGSTLSEAARALAKHSERSSEEWWGHLHGNDLKKNKLALDVINRLLNNCCFMNIHFIQPYNSVFEIRVAEGYGARWSSDGSKFIGFLEPYMVEGFSKGWKH
ncbi:hypothetical protein LUZ60_007604 [Juncus effusus]|nr:hypothetical protein LUZ60_007604 [Juncus effusus]